MVITLKTRPISRRKSIFRANYCEARLIGSLGEFLSYFSDSVIRVFETKERKILNILCSVYIYIYTVAMKVFEKLNSITEEIHL